MKVSPVISILRQFLIVLTVLLATQPTSVISAQAVLQQPGVISQTMVSGSQKSAAAASGCQWTYYPVSGGKLQPEQLLYNDPDNTPLTDLSLGSMYKGKSSQLTSTGSTDFDGDNKTDVFRTVLRPDGNLQWQYSSGGTGAWVDLAYATSALPAIKSESSTATPIRTSSPACMIVYCPGTSGCIPPAEQAASRT